MLVYVDIILFVVGLIVSIFAYYKSMTMEIYKYLRWVFLINTIVGFLFLLHTIALSISIELYYKLPALSSVAATLFIIDLFIFAHGNISETLKKVLSVEMSTIAIPSLLLLAEAEPIRLTVGSAMALFLAGMTVSLIVELIYGTSKAYSVMKGGRLYSFWRRMLLLSVLFAYAGVTYSLVGVMAMTNLLTLDLIYFLISIAFLISSFFTLLTVQHYEKELKPIISMIAEEETS